MDENKHTPGAWEYEHGWLYRRGVSPTGMGYTDTILRVDDAAFCPSEADASLIAAAPDMLAALKLVANSGKFSCFFDDAWDVVNDAISKAEGK